MKRNLILSLVVLITMAPDMLFAAALDHYKAGDNCFTNRDTFLYCGKPNTKGKKNVCNNIKQNSGDSGSTYSYGAHKEVDGTDYVCCGNPDEVGGGRWKETPTTDEKYENLTYTDADGNEKKYSELTSVQEKMAARTITLNLEGGGTCNYQLSLDDCGKDISKKCTEPDGCVKGLILRNGVCVTPCASGQGYESINSNTCIECPTTIKGGIDNNATIKAENNTDVANPNYGVCVKCHETAELFSYKTGKCHIKRDIESQYTNAAFQKCWKCESNVDFQACVDKFKGANVDVSKWPSGIPASCGDGK